MALKSNRSVAGVILGAAVQLVRTVVQIQLPGFGVSTTQGDSVAGRMKCSVLASMSARQCKQKSECWLQFCINRISYNLAAKWLYLCMYFCHASVRKPRHPAKCTECKYIWCVLWSYIWILIQLFSLAQLPAICVCFSFISSLVSGGCGQHWLMSVFILSLILILFYDTITHAMQLYIALILAQYFTRTYFIFPTIASVRRIKNLCMKCGLKYRIAWELGNLHANLVEKAQPFTILHYQATDILPYGQDDFCN